MKILLIRLMGLGDIAAILVPAVRIYKRKYPDASINVLTYQAGEEIMRLHPDVDEVMSISTDDWPDDLFPAIESFMRLGEAITRKHFNLIINLDTWFMPCFLSRALMDASLEVHGNFLKHPVEKFFIKVQDGAFDQDFFSKPGRYMSSTFSNMADWHRPWWNEYPDLSYPYFYLRHCCGFTDEISIKIPCTVDNQLKDEADGRTIVAISAQGRAEYKRYRHDALLKRLLEEKGYFCWDGFDGSIPMQTTLNRLYTSAILVTVPTSTQWLARLAECPSLMLPGPMAPSLLGAEYTVQKQTDCQYCFHETSCPENRDYKCMDIPADDVLAEVIAATN